MNQSGLPASEAGLARVTYLPGARPQAGLRDGDPQEDSRDQEDSGDREDSGDQEAPVEAQARAANISMHALTRRGVSSDEMRKLLRSRELAESAVTAEVERLEGVGLLDDSALAETLVRTLHERKGLGRAALTAELRRRALPIDAIQSALASIDTDDELARATELALKRVPQLRSLDPETAKRRLSAFLMRKGYSGSVVGTAVAHALPRRGPVFR